MWPFRRRPRTRIATYGTESTPAALRIIRTHIAAQAGELGNLNVAVGQLGAQAGQIESRLTTLHTLLSQIDARLELALPALRGERR